MKGRGDYLSSLSRPKLSGTYKEGKERKVKFSFNADNEGSEVQKDRFRRSANSGNIELCFLDYNVSANESTNFEIKVTLIHVRYLVIHFLLLSPLVFC